MGNGSQKEAEHKVHWKSAGFLYYSINKKKKQPLLINMDLISSFTEVLHVHNNSVSGLSCQKVPGCLHPFLKANQNLWLKSAQPTQNFTLKFSPEFIMSNSGASEPCMRVSRHTQATPDLRWLNQPLGSISVFSLTPERAYTFGLSEEMVLIWKSKFSWDATSKMS